MGDDPNGQNIKQVLRDPKRTERLCQEFAKEFWDKGIEVVVGLGRGGAVMASHTARHIAIMGCRTDTVYSVFAGQHSDGRWALEASDRELLQGRQVLVITAEKKNKDEQISSSLLALIADLGGRLKGVSYADGSLLPLPLRARKQGAAT